MLVLAALPILGLVGNASALAQAFRDESVLKALKLSLLSSGIALALILLFGTPLAFLVAARRQAKAGCLVSGLLRFSMYLPPAAAGLGLLLVLGQKGWMGGMLGSSWFPFIAVVLAQCFVSAPYFIQSAARGLERVTPGLKEAAFLEGATSIQILQQITLPMAWRELAAGTFLAWARALAEFGTTLIFAGNIPGKSQTLPLAIFANYETHPQQAIAAALALAILGLAMMLLVKAVEEKPAEL